MTPVFLRAAILLALASTGCRLGIASVSKVEVWTPGQRAIVMPMRGTEVTDAQVAAVVNDQLRRLGDIEIVAPAPSNVPVPSGDPHEACAQALVLGADYVVLTSADISVLDNRVCLVGTDLLSKIVLPLPIPLPRLGTIAVVDVPVAPPDKCLASVEIGNRWAVTANAQVFTTERCLATGGQFAIARGTDGTLPDGVALQAEIEKKTADLFPGRATITRVDGHRGIVDAPRNMRPGDLYEVRNGGAGGSLAYVRRADARGAVLEPYAPTDEIRSGDLLLRRGKPQWIEFLAYGASSQILVGGDRHLASGAGGLFRGQLGKLSIGLTAEYLRILDGAARRETATTSSLKGGLQGGFHHHVSTRLDAYGLFELGYTAALGITKEGDDDRAPYVGAFVGARLALGKWFAGLELGAVYSGMQSFAGHASVGQRGAAARLTFGRNVRLDM